MGRNEDDRKRFWERLDTPTKVIGAIVASLVGLLTAGAIVLRAFGDDDLTPAVRATRIGDCMAQHDLRARRVVDGVRNGKRLVFRRCDWPPPNDTSPDGYSEIVDTLTFLPKGNGEPYNTVDALRAPCEEMDVTFVLDHMFGRAFVSRRLQVGRLYLVTTASGASHKPVLAVRALTDTPLDVQDVVAPPRQSSTTSFILRSGHFDLFDAHCAAGS